MTKQTVAIVGGGMVGSVLALLLVRHVPNLTVTLFDKHPATELANTSPSRPSFDGRSTAIAPTTAACFKQLGLWQSLQHFATAIEKIHVSDRGHAGLGVFDADDNRGEPLGYVVENSGLGQTLLQAVANESGITTVAANVTDLGFTAEGAKLCWLNAEQPVCEHFNVAILADGANSRLRHSLGIAVKRVDYRQHALVANVRHSLAHQLQAYERFTARGPLALLPKGGHANSHESGLVWTCPVDELEQFKNLSTPARLAELQAQFGFRLGHFTAMSDAVFYPLELVVAQEQVRSRLVVMGNAAHFLHPVAGQGFNLSVRDSLRLTDVFKAAAKQGKDLGDLAVLKIYEQAQLADQSHTIGLSHGFNRLFTQAPLPVQLMRTLGMLALELNPLLRGQFIGLLSGRAQPQVQL